MSPISLPLPNVGDMTCYATTTQNVIQCFSPNLQTRRTYLLQLDNSQSNNGWLLTAQDYSNYGVYNPTGAPIGEYIVFPELTNFWFPVFSCIIVAFIFFLVYKIMFARFIK